MNNKNSTLKIYMGCMFSGKSTSLLNEAQRYRHVTDNILLINHVYDRLRNDITPINGIGEIKTHDNKCGSALMLNELRELYSNDFYFSKYSRADVVIIDEAQFFGDLFSFVKSELQRNDIKKIFIVGGLSGDFKMNHIGDLYKLIPFADEIVKLNAYCVMCKDGTIGSFTKRIGTNTDQILVGNNANYLPVCRYHHQI